jgi:hypothetical protein
LDRNRNKLKQRPQSKKKLFKDGEEFLYLGNPVTLTLGKYAAIAVKGSTLEFPKFLEFRIQTELTNWYLKQAKTIITDRVIENAHEMNVDYKSLTFSDTKSKWGSCSHDNRLQFCWRLVMSPIIVINYVVIHELSHITQKNHSERFLKRVRSFNR